MTEQNTNKAEPATGTKDERRPTHRHNGTAIASASRRDEASARDHGPGLRKHPITGRGGGGKGGAGSGGTPTEEPDSLQSSATAKVIELLCEGEIAGLANEAQSIFFGDTPLKAEDGSDNFSGVDWLHTKGAPDQEPMPGFPDVETDISVATEVTQLSGPVIRTITNPDLDAVRLLVRVPQLSRITDDGDVVGSEVTLRVRVRPGAGPNADVWLDPIINRGWVSFSDQTADFSTGLEVTVTDQASGVRSAPFSVHVEYRAVGAADWLLLGKESGRVRLSRVRSRQRNDDGYTYTYRTVTVSRTYTKRDLPSGVYEVRAVVGTISNQRGFSPVDITIRGKTTSGYEQAYRVELPPGGDPWDIKLERVTEDSTSSKLQNSLIWQSYTELIDDKFRFPDSALVGLVIDSKLFGGSIPTRSYDIKGLIIDVPTGYDPQARTYPVIWDGTFTRAWTDNPAWCLRDLLINTRYGLGLDEADVDKWALYQISKYCDELVPDGFGGQEPRFTLNSVIQTREEAYAVINSLVSVFRGMVYWASGTVTVSQDSPEDPDRLVTPANVIDGEFGYSGTALKSRHTAALVQWNDPEEGYRPTIAMIEDAAGIFKFGYRPAEVVAFGTTSKGQAHRLGKWLLDTERSATETVSYKAGMDHADLAPGKIIAVADPDYAGVRMGGRIKSATATEVVIDAPVTMDPGEIYTLSVVLPDQQVAKVAVVNQATTLPVQTTTLTLAAGETLAPTPLPNAIWVLSASNVAPRLFRVLSNVEIKSNVFEITALLHDPNKFARIEQDLILDSNETTRLETGPLLQPTALNISEFLFLSGSQIAAGVTISWTASRDSRVQFYAVDVKRPELDWERIGQTNLPSVDLRDVQAGRYGFRVVAIDRAGGASPFLSVEDYTLEGLTTPPADVQNLINVVQGGQTVLVWEAVEDLRPISYQVRKGPSFKTAQIIDEVANRQVAATGDGTYWVVAKTSQARSVNPAFIIIEGASIFANVVANFDEGLEGWLGPVSGGALALLGAVKLVGVGPIDGIVDIRAVPDIVFLGGVAGQGTYQIPASHVIDLGATRLSQVTIDYELRGDAPAADFRDVLDVRALPSIRGEYGDFVSAIPELRTAGDDGVWSPWRSFTPGQYGARQYDLRITLTTTSPEITAVLDKFTFCVDMPDRIDQGTAIPIPAAGSNIVYPQTFQIAPNLQVTIIGAQAGDDVVLTNQTDAGFHVEIRNGGAGVAREINYFAQGY